MTGDHSGHDGHDRHDGGDDHGHGGEDDHHHHDVETVGLAVLTVSSSRTLAEDP